MKKNILMPLGICLFVLAIFGCDQKNVADISIAPNPVTSTFSKGYYVSDALGSDANNGLSPTSPIKTIGAAYNLVAAGDTVFIMNGTYNGGTILTITKSGTADKYITFKAYPGHKPKLFSSGAIYNAVIINGSYIIFDGIELQGDNANLTYAGAYAAYTTAYGGGALSPQYNTNGISIGGSKTESKFPHHVIIKNCKVHDFPGGGISSIQADYTSIMNDTVYNNAWYMMYAGSGISILNPFNSDAPDITKYKNIVMNNVVYNNFTQIPWVSLTPAALSDGNGIIIDVNQYAYGQTPTTPNPTAYTGRTLVQNNISYNNGGSGIHSFRADHTDIINNTAFGNGTKVGYADIFAGYANDVKIMNNIMYARTGGKCTTNGNNTNVTFDYNIYFNGTVAVTGAHDKVANPQFINGSIDPLVANFFLNSGSPAINAGTQTLFAPTDILGVTRPKGGAVDCGAYEVQ